MITAERQATSVISTSVSKIFILDTNVILHDAGCLQNFEENDIAIPITVLEELDRFKKGNEDIHFQARQFLRQLDELTGDLLSEDGVSLGEGLGHLRVYLGSEFDQKLKDCHLTPENPDHRILNISLKIRNEFEATRPVIVVSKDTNLRMKAKAIGLVAQDYTTDKLESDENIYTGKRFISGVETELVDRFYEGMGYVPEHDVPHISNPKSNENFIIRNGQKSVLATYSGRDQHYRRVEKLHAYGIHPRNAEQAFALRALLDPEIKLVSIGGKAGSGKTLLALAAALECRSMYRQIMLARPVVPLSNRDIGFLPGDVSAKLDPYMQPLFDNLNVIRHEGNQGHGNNDKIQELLENGKLEITPLAYIRGRSLQRIFFIIDEAQNLTPLEIKTIVTRAGEGTKIIFTGDIHQIDHPYLDSLSNGMSHVMNRMMGQHIYAHITLEKGERSELAEIASDLL